MYLCVRVCVYETDIERRKSDTKSLFVQKRTVHNKLPYIWTDNTQKAPQNMHSKT